MTAPKDRGSKYRFKKTASETKKVYFEEKGKRKVCAITGEKLSGTSSGQKGKVSKESKSQRRPSVPFGGILGGKAREEVFTELGKVAAGIKTLDQVDEKYKKYIKQAIKRVE
jgi:ribosomal protein L34E